MNDFKPVSRDEFYEFVHTYPRRLEYELLKAQEDQEPHVRTWSDPTVGDGPDGVVAACRQGGLGYRQPECEWIVRFPP